MKFYIELTIVLVFTKRKRSFISFTRLDWQHWWKAKKNETRYFDRLSWTRKQSFNSLCLRFKFERNWKKRYYYYFFREIGKSSSATIYRKRFESSWDYFAMYENNPSYLKKIYPYTIRYDTILFDKNLRKNNVISRVITTFQVVSWKFVENFILSRGNRA